MVLLPLVGFCTKGVDRHISAMISGDTHFSNLSREMNLILLAVDAVSQPLMTCVWTHGYTQESVYAYMQRRRI